MTRRLLLCAILLAAVSLQGEMRLEQRRESLSGTHCRYRRYDSGIPTDQFTVVPCPAGLAALSEPAVLQLGDGSRHFVNGRLVRRVIVEETPLEPFALDYDTATGELVQRVPLFFTGKPVRIFDPNPVVTLNDPSLQDRNDSASAVPENGYTDAEIDDAEPSGPLRGPWASIVDRQPPAIPAVDAGGPLLFHRDQSGFEDVNAFFHIDRQQRYLQSLGYRGSRTIAPYSIEVDTHAANGSDNSFYLPSATNAGRGTLYFGTGGTDDAEDADLLVHEYGHAILDWISPGTFGGTFGSESRALSEGLGDYFGFSAHYASRVASGRDPFCFADWDARCWEDDPSQQCGYAPGTDCLRRLDDPRIMADYERVEASGVEHRNGRIWSSALREIFVALTDANGLEEGKRIADSVIVESLFDAPPHPTYAVMAVRLMEADRQLYGGAHLPTICAAMEARAIVSGCVPFPRGEETLFQSSDHDLPIPENDPAGVESTLTIDDPRAIADLAVRVDIAHTARGDLRIDLVAPDGTVVMLQQVSMERAPDIHVTYGRDASTSEPLSQLIGRSAAGVWKLRVYDMRNRDVGTLLSWGLIITFAGDQRLEARPVVSPTQTIPVVTHVYGRRETTFRSDVRISSTFLEPQTATLIFTPSGADGSTTFSAIRVIVPPQGTVAFDDVVASAFRSVGSGSLEVQGNVQVMSRTYAETASGTLGQQVPPARVSTTVNGGDLVLAAMPVANDRYNAGVAEIAGGRGTAWLTGCGETRFVDIAPWSHVQLDLGCSYAFVGVYSGDATIVAYISQVQPNGDAMFIPAAAAASRNEIAPALSSGPWHTDLWWEAAAIEPPAYAQSVEYLTPETAVSEVVDPVEYDLVARRFGQPDTAGALVSSTPGARLLQTRIVHGETTEYVPFMALPSPLVQHLLFVENGEGYRTNIGIVAADDAVAEVTVLDAAGGVVEEFRLAIPRGTTWQSVSAPVVHGSARVVFTGGSGRAWVSLIDTRSGDATFFEGQ